MPGHWEGDLIVGTANKTAAATLAERTSRHALVVPLPDGCTAPAVADAVTASTTDRACRLSLILQLGEATL